QTLEIAVVIRHADRADVVALGEQQLHDHLAVLVQPLRVCRHRHAFLDARHAGWGEFRGAFDLDKAEAAASDQRQAVKLAESRNPDAVLARDLQDRLVLAGADVLAVDDQRLDPDRRDRHGVPSPAWWPLMGSIIGSEASVSAA